MEALDLGIVSKKHRRNEDILEDVSKQFNFFQTFQDEFSKLASQQYLTAQNQHRNESVNLTNIPNVFDNNTLNIKPESPKTSVHFNNEIDTQNKDFDVSTNTNEDELNNSKEELQDDNNLCPLEVTIKEENDCEFLDPFLEDCHGTTNNSDYKINCENSYNIAVLALKNGTEPTANLYECKYCHLIFKHTKRFIIHYKWHTFGLKNNINKRKLNSDTKEIKNKKVCVKKPKKVVDEDRTYDCTQCDAVLKTVNALRLHKAKHHSKDHKCKTCNVTVGDYKALQQHMDDVHLCAEGYPCPVCAKSFKRPQTLNKHVQTHNEKTHTCPECPKSFGSRQLLNTHMKCHIRARSEPSYHCLYCGKGFHETYQLQVHERTHRNEKPFKCDVCGTCYSTKSTLKRHVNVSHSTEKPFECPKCHRHFNAKRGYDRHLINAHTDTAPNNYNCAECGDKFARSKDLQKHKYSAHPKKKRNSYYLSGSE